MSTFKINGVGLDTENLDYYLQGDEGFSYLHVSLSANNAYLLSNYFKANPETSLIVSTDFLDNLPSALIGLLLILEKKEIDLLLISGKCDWTKYREDLEALVSAGTVLEIGVKCPESEEQLGEIMKVVPIPWISMPLSPFSFQSEFTKIPELKILGLNPFGGHLNSAMMIDTFSVPYLLGFSAYYSTLPVLSCRDLERSYDCRDYLTTLIGKEAGNIYELGKSVNKLKNAPIKNSISTALHLSDGTVVPYQNPAALFNHEELALSFKPLVEDDPEETDIFKEMSSLIDSLKKPEDMTCDEDFLSIVLPRVKTILQIENPESIVSMAKIGSTTFVFSITKEVVVKKRFFSVDKTEIKSEYYIFYYSSGSLRCFKKASPGPSES